MFECGRTGRASLLFNRKSLLFLLFFCLKKFDSILFLLFFCLKKSGFAKDFGTYAHKGASFGNGEEIIVRHAPRTLGEVGGIGEEGGLGAEEEVVCHLKIVANAEFVVRVRSHAHDA